MKLPQHIEGPLIVCTEQGIFQAKLVKFGKAFNRRSRCSTCLMQHSMLRVAATLKRIFSDFNRSSCGSSSSNSKNAVFSLNSRALPSSKVNDSSDTICLFQSKSCIREGICISIQRFTRVRGRRCLISGPG